MKEVVLKLEVPKGLEPKVELAIESELSEEKAKSIWSRLKCCWLLMLR